MSAETGTSLAAERRYVGVVGTALTAALLHDGLLSFLVLCSLQNERKHIVPKGSSDFALQLSNPRYTVHPEHPSISKPKKWPVC
jgi:hypothetical protein